MRFLFVDLETVWGSTERYAFWLMSALRSRGHWVGCIAARPEFEPACHRLWVVEGRPQSSRRRRALIEAAAAEERVDVVHYNADRAIRLAPFVLPDSRVATVATRCSEWPANDFHLRWSIQRCLTDFAVRRVGRCIRVSSSLLTEVADAARVRAAHGVLDAPHRPPRVVRPVTDRVAFVGSLSEENGAGDVLELARRSAARPPVERRWRLSVAGSGPLAAEVERLERELPPGIITYLGAPADPSRLYASAAALILPSSNVGMTSLVFGAFSWAVPAVAYDSPAVREIVADGRNGLLVSRADGAVGLERALDRLLGDPAACVRLGWAARADYEATHRGESFIDETIGLLERAGRRAARAGAQRARSATHAGGYEPTVGYLELKRTRAPVTR